MQFWLSAKLKLTEARTISDPLAQDGLQSIWAYVTKRMLLATALEFIVTSIHTPPYYQKDFRLEYLGNISVYRMESVMAVLTMARLWFIWRWMREKIHHSYFNLEVHHLLRDAATIKLLQSEDLPLRMLALKLSIKGSPLRAVTLLSVTVLFTMTYLMRVAEGPAAQPHSVYLW